MLEINHLSWTTPDRKEVIKDISLTIPDGKLVVITGPNGGGKTSLAKLIAGLEMPSEGSIVLNGEDITKMNVTERAKRGISFAFQQPVRFKGITVRQLMEIASGEKMNEATMCKILGNVGLCAKDYADREVNSTLSGGEMKRIEIATVLARHTELTVFDEPEAGIDLWSFKSLIEVFEDIRKSLKGSMVIISHQERILKIADEIVVLADGQISSTGGKDQMLCKVMGEDCKRPSCCRKEQ